MTHTERAIDLLLFLQRLPRDFEAIRGRYSRVSERTLWRHLAELREVADLYQDSTGRYTIPVRMFLNDVIAASRGNHEPTVSPRPRPEGA